MTTAPPAAAPTQAPPPLPAVDAAPAAGGVPAGPDLPAQAGAGDPVLVDLPVAAAPEAAWPRAQAVAPGGARPPAPEVGGVPAGPVFPLAEAPVPVPDWIPTSGAAGASSGRPPTRADLVRAAKIRPPGVPPAGRRAGPIPLPGAPSREPAPRDRRWWLGAAITCVSALLLAFVAHAAVFSGLQHQRAQDLAYKELRVALAKAEAPTGQLGLDQELLAPGTPVALLQIPRIGVAEVVREGTAAGVLRGGPGHRRDSVLPGQPGTTVVMGRQATYGAPFQDLGRLVPGDLITLTTAQGAATYRVFGLRRAGDPLPEPLRSGQGRLELMTADGMALMPDGVLHVDAELAGDAWDASSRVMAYAALPAAERAMGQDAGAWFPALCMALFYAAAAVAVWWLWRRWGRWQAWLIGLPVLLALGAASFDLVMNALPNLI